MNGLMPVFSEPWAQALAWTLIHFLWQGAVIGLAAYAVLRMTRLSSSARYGVGVAALAAMLVAPVGTFVVATSSPVAPADPAAFAEMATPELSARADVADAEAVPAAPASPAPGASLYLRLVLLAWAIGVVALSLRLLGGWLVARRLAHRALTPVSAEVHALARRIAGRIALDRVVRLFESTAVAVPVTVGWMKPVVLLPASAMSGLSTMQIEALLAHELAHVRRHDYLVNLLQSAVETLLFYHPAVWWASRVIRVEREHCCDDVAVGVCDRLTYVSALSDLASMTAAPRVAMAATNGSLLSRVRRLLGQPSDDGLAASWVPAILVMLLAVTIVPALVAQSAGVGAGQSGQGAATGSVRVGVATGVGSGVVDAVATGVAGGSVNGAGSSVNAGIAGGVSQGVRGGIATGVLADGRVIGAVTAQSADRADQERERTERARAQALAELERQIARLAAEARSEQAQMERQRAMIAMQAVREQSEVELQALSARVEAAAEELQRALQRVENGLAPPASVAEAERALQEAQRQIVQQQLELRTRMQDFELTVRAAEGRQERAAELAQLEYALREARGQSTSDEARDRQREIQERLAMVARELDARQVDERDRQVQVLREIAQQNRVVAAELEARGRADVETLREVAAERSLADTDPVTDASAQVQERDVLVIRISGESALPVAYTVDTSGNIRLPLIGTLPVRGQTIAQVRAAVTNLLADRQLARGSTISVELRRPRLPNRRH